MRCRTHARSDTVSLAVVAVCACVAFGWGSSPGPVVVSAQAVMRNTMFIVEGLSGRKVSNADMVDGGNRNLLISTGLEYPSSIALDVDARRMYFTERGNGAGTEKIISADMADGGNRVDLITSGLDDPSSIVLDVAAGRMYFTDGNPGVIASADMADGGNRVDLITDDINTPVSVALDIDAGRMYFADTFNHRISSADMADGGNRFHIDSSGIPSPKAVALDLVARRMYVLLGGSVPSIIAMDMAGGNRVELINALAVSKFGNAVGIALDVEAGRLYYTDSGRSAVSAIDMVDGSNHVNLITTGLSEPEGIALWLACDPACEACTGSTVADCFENAAGFRNCSAGFTTSGDGTTCVACTTTCAAGTFETATCTAASDLECGGVCDPACASCTGAAATDCVELSAGVRNCTADYKTSIDGTTCVERPVLRNTMFFADGIGAGTISSADATDGGNYADVLTGLSHPNGVALDTAGERLYFADRSLEVISSVAFGGGGGRVDIITTGLADPFGIALDAAAGRVYFTDVGVHIVSSADMADGANRVDLLDNVILGPQRVALDIEAGRMYIPDTGHDRIVCADMADGDNLSEIVSTDMFSPLDIALDLSARRMYIVQIQRISVMGMDNGGDRFDLINAQGSGNPELASVGGIALDVAAGRLYFTDAGRDMISAVDMADGSNRADLVTTRVFNPNGISLWLPCDRACESCRGSTAAQCFQNAAGFRNCSAGFTTSGDGTTCVACSTTCAAGTFQTGPCTAAQDTVCGGVCDDACASCTGAAATECVELGAGHRDCASGYTTSGDGTTCVACLACDPGAYVTAACSATSDAVCGGVCDVACASCTGPAATDCAVVAEGPGHRDCASGFTTSDDGTTCVACASCAAGVFAPAACTASVNTLCDGVCDDACVSCTGAASTDCVQLGVGSRDCASGYTTSDDGSACVPCDSTCTTCDSAQPTGCTACSPGRFLSPIGADSTAGTCSMCECAAGTVPTTLCTTTAAPVCSTCPLPRNCPGVSGALASSGVSAMGSAGNSTWCAGDGVDPASFLCSQCLPGHFPLNGACRECPGASAALPIALGVVAMAFVAFLVLRGSPDSRLQELLRALAVFIQTINVYVSFNVEWPQWVLDMWRLLQGLVFDIALYSPRCALEGGWYASFGATLAVIAFIFSLSAVARVLVGRRARRAADAGRSAEWHHKTAADLRLLQVTLAMLAFVPLLRVLLESSDCVDTPEGSRLQPDATITCTSAGHMALMIVALVAAVALAVGFPVWLVWHFRRVSAAGTLHKDPRAKQFRDLLSPYKEGVPYFEGIVLLHRAVGVWMLVSFADGIIQSIVTLAVTVLLLVLVVRLRPWRPFALFRSTDAMNQLTIASLGAQSVALLCGLISAVVPDSAETLGGIASIIAGLTGIGLLVCCITHRLRTRQFKAQSKAVATVAGGAGDGQGDPEGGGAATSGAAGGGGDSDTGIAMKSMSRGGKRASTGSASGAGAGAQLELGVSADTAYVVAADAAHLARRQLADQAAALEAEDSALRAAAATSDDVAAITRRRRSVTAKLTAARAAATGAPDVSAAKAQVLAQVPAARRAVDEAAVALARVRPSHGSAGDADIGKGDAAPRAVAAARAAVEAAATIAREAHDNAARSGWPETALEVKKEVWDPELGALVARVRPVELDAGSASDLDDASRRIINDVNKAAQAAGKQAAAAQKRERKASNIKAAVAAVQEQHVARDRFAAAWLAAFDAAAESNLDTALLVHTEGVRLYRETTGLRDAAGVAQSDVRGLSDGEVEAAAAATDAARAADAARAKRDRARALATSADDAEMERGGVMFDEAKAELAAARDAMRAKARELGSWERRQYRTAAALEVLAAVEA